MSSLRKLRRQQERKQAPKAAANLSLAIEAIGQLKDMGESLQGVPRIEQFLNDARREVAFLIDRQSILDREISIQQELMIRLLSRDRNIPIEVLRVDIEKIRKELELDAEALKVIELP